MPTVKTPKGTKSFPYTERGRKEAEEMARKTGGKVSHAPKKGK